MKARALLCTLQERWREPARITKQDRDTNDPSTNFFRLESGKHDTRKQALGGEILGKLGRVSGYLKLH